jgi:hypothetical protein
MLSVESGSQTGSVRAFATSGRGLNVEEITEMCLNKMLHVADTAAPALKDQARMFRAQMKVLLMQYMHQAIRSDRTTLYNNLRGAGHSEVADLILKI